MARSAALAASVTACLMAASACSANHYLKRGTELYGEGRYVEADEVFERSEQRVARAPMEKRASYALYRGATFVALGDLPRAQHWLRIASEIEHALPGSLKPEERIFLDSSWRALASRLPGSPPPATTAIASSSQVPSPSAETLPPAIPAPPNSSLPQ